MANPPPPYDDITGISRAVMKLYYSGSTTDLVWKFNTPGAGAWQAGAHFDISGTYQIA